MHQEIFVKLGGGNNKQWSLVPPYEAQNRRHSWSLIVPVLIMYACFVLKHIHLKDDFIFICTYIVDMQRLMGIGSIIQVFFNNTTVLILIIQLIITTIFIKCKFFLLTISPTVHSAVKNTYLIKLILHNVTK